jgi:hypothetical protein
MTKRKKGSNEIGMVEKHVMPKSQFFEQIHNGDLLHQVILHTMEARKQRSLSEVL